MALWRTKQPAPLVDYEELAESVGALREILQAIVAGLRADGFTDEQARAMATSIFTNQ